MENEYILRESKVLSIDDEYGGMRIKVRLDGLDNSILNDNDLPYCFPFMPKLIHITPKVGEAVVIILERCGTSTSNRFYIGPILSQPYFYKHELYDISAFNMLLNRSTIPMPDPSRCPENDGSLPEIEDVALVGRDNADIVLKESEIRLRCGHQNKFNGLVGERLYLNKIDPAYIQMKYKKMKDEKGRDISSFINIIADRINLISRDNGYQTNDPQNIIPDDELLRFVNKAHPLAYGDDIVRVLKDILKVLRTHTHPFPMCPPSFNKSDLGVFEQNLDAMLSDNVRIS